MYSDSRSIQRSTLVVVGRSRRSNLASAAWSVRRRNSRLNINIRKCSTARTIEYISSSYDAELRSEPLSARLKNHTGCSSPVSSNSCFRTAQTANLLPSVSKRNSLSTSGSRTSGEDNISAFNSSNFALWLAVYSTTFILDALYKASLTCANDGTRVR